MKYVAVTAYSSTKEYGNDVSFVYGFGRLQKNAILALKKFREEKEKQGIKIKNVKKKSFETDE